MRKRLGTLLISVLLFTLLAAMPGGATPAAADDAAWVHLARVTFDPLAGEPALDGLLSALDEPAAGDSIYLVQFDGIVQEEWKQAVEAAGLELLGYVPDNTFVARRSGGAAAQALPHVRWIGPYRPAYKIAPSLDDSLQSAASVDLIVSVFPGADGRAVADVARALGGQPAEIIANALVGDALALTLPGYRIGDLARQPSVAWIEPRAPDELHNDRAREIMGVTRAQESLAGFGTPLYGAGQIVAVADTGLDTGNAGTLSLDFRDNLIGAYALGRTDDWSDGFAGCIQFCGHGTHAAGSVLGNGSHSGANPAGHVYDGSFAGVAPEAGLIFQSLMNSSEALVTPLDLGQLFRPAHDDGARVHSNSWGHSTGNASNPYGGYDYPASTVDAFMWLHPTSLVVFSVGNWGADANSDGVIDLDQIASPATAKNALSVGATENNRPPFTGFGGYSNYQWGTGSWASKYPVDPIRYDYISDNSSGVAAFSSRGPTDDGRIKPEVAAPGTDIISARSHGIDARVGWGLYNDHYTYNGGTSMAAPLAAGAAALVRQYYVDYAGLADPSAALVKATLVNGARNITPGQYGAGATREIPETTPNNVIGYGRIDLPDSLGLGAGENLSFWDATAGLATGASSVYTVTIMQAGGAEAQFAATLCWTDRPGSVYAARELVNDLDLEVIGPGNVHYAGNGVAGGDRLNNTERVVIAQPLAGEYQIIVRAHNAPLGPQPYALVVQSEYLSESPNPTPTVTVTPSPTSLTPTPTATVTPTATETALPDAGWTTILEDGFEGEFPGEWSTSDGSGAGEYYWAWRDCEAYAGAQSAWAVGGGADGGALTCGSEYPNDADAWLIYGPFSLAGATDAEWQFQLWLNSQGDHDYFYYLISTDGQSFRGYQSSGQIGGWITRTMSLSADPHMGSYLGQDEVWVAFVFASDGSQRAVGGAFVDDVIVRKKAPASATPTGTVTATPTATLTGTPTETGTPTATATDAPPATSTATATPTGTATETSTSTVTVTATAAVTATATATEPAALPAWGFLPLLLRQGG
jgi:hypothetical protein